jgi:hypothetical protein
MRSLEDDDGRAGKPDQDGDEAGSESGQPGLVKRILQRFKKEQE